MYLLELKSHGDFGLSKFVGDDIPRYAILSHTWGAEDDEVTFRDMIDGIGKSKTGYSKIEFCGEQATRDGLKYFWVDSCCIDKSSSAELQEAINSMFRWYRDAARCYVYLSDVSITKRKASDQFSKFTWDPAFRVSRWFTRGWTLQELLAPTSVEFFSQERRRLGDKKSLERQIHEITGITLKALQGFPLSQFSVDERFSWAEERQTTRKEDWVYSLLGIFDIHMPLIYGEGREKAIIRLRKEIDEASKGPERLLNRLPYAKDASFNSFAKQHEPSCLENTRVDVLREIYNWADGQDKRCIFWLNGLAGTGKSTIARTVARKYYEQKRLGASFFFSRGGGDVGHAGKFFTSIAVQIANEVPSLQKYIWEAITESSDIENRSLSDQWCQLILSPLLKVDRSTYYSSYILVIDALDECDDENNIRIILSLLAEARSLKAVRLRIFITSRPEIPIRHGVYQMPEAEHQDFILHNVSPAIVDHDIATFLERKFGLIRQERGLSAGWPGEEVIKGLVQSASGLFIWAATAYRFIHEGRRFAAKRLAMILESSNHAITAPQMHLNVMYITVLKNSISSDYTAEEKEEFCGMLRHILGSVAILHSPLTAHSLSRLLDILKDTVDQTLEDLHAILDIPEVQNRPLRLHHPSLRDFLLDKDRCGDSKFWVDEKQAHRTLAAGCIQLLANSLKQDICGLDIPGALVSEVESSRVEQCLPPEVQYACLYWVQHLQKSGARLYDDDRVHWLLQTHFLHWLEALSWIQKLSDGILAISLLESIVPMYDCLGLYAFVHDMRRFAIHSRYAIEQTPLQVYSSALIFAPTMSIVRKQFEDRIPQWILRLPDVQKDWSASLQTLEGHSDCVNAVAFSPNGKQLASASDDRSIRLWDASSGAALQTLEGHSEPISAVTFSPNGKLLAPASADSTVKLWDAGSGVVLQTLEGHSKWVCSVAFSPNGKQLVSASVDRSIRLWDVSSGVALQTLEGHSQFINAVTFSPNGKLLASASADSTIRLWDASSGVALLPLERHLGAVNAVAFSPNGKQLASASVDKTIKLWDAGSGVVLQTLEGHLCSVRAVAFSPNDKLLASTSEDNTIRLWDASLGLALQTLKGHSALVSAVAFSPNGKLLASASHDNTVRLWSVNSGAALQTLEGHLNNVSIVTFSLDGKLLASAARDNTVRLWDADLGAALQTLKGHSAHIDAIAFSPNGKQLASASVDGTVELWDAGSGAALQTTKVCAITRTHSFSNNGTSLNTNLGLLPVISLPSSVVPSQQGSSRGIFVQKQWVTWGTESMLWLPPEYRPGHHLLECAAVYGSVVALGCGSGLVSIMEFAF